MKFFDFIMLIVAITIAIIATIFVSADRAFAIFLIIIGAWLIHSGCFRNRVEHSLIGIFSTSAVKVGWGGFFVSASVAWLVQRIIGFLWQLALAIFIIGIILTLILAQIVEKKAKKKNH